MAGRFSKRREARDAVEAERIALRDSLRTWWTERSEARKKAAKKARERAALTSRGVDRVPKHLQGLARTEEYLVQHTDAPRSWRRRRHLNTGRRMTTSTNVPHVNPRRDAKSAKSGRLRKELRS